MAEKEPGKRKISDQAILITILVALVLFITIVMLTTGRNASEPPKVGSIKTLVKDAVRDKAEKAAAPDETSSNEASGEAPATQE